MTAATPTISDLAPLARQRAQALLEMRRHDLASRELAMLLTINPHDSWALASLATCRRVAGDTNGARRLADDAIAADPNYAYAYTIRAWVGGLDREQTRQVLQTAVKLAPSRADSWYQLGRYYSDTGQGPPARHAASKCLELDPEHVGARRLWAEDHWINGRFHHAIGILYDALRIAPEDAPVHWQLAYYLSCVGRIHESLTHQAKVIELVPNDPAQQDHYLKLFYRASPFYLLAMLAINAGPSNLGRIHWLAAGGFLVIGLGLVERRINEHQETYALLTTVLVAASFGFVQAFSTLKGEWISDQLLRRDPLARRIVTSRRHGR